MESDKEGTFTRCANVQSLSSSGSDSEMLVTVRSMTVRPVTAGTLIHSDSELEYSAILRDANS